MNRIDDDRFLEAVATCTTRPELWSRFLNLTQARTVVEIGVWRGDLSRYLLETCDALERYYLIDPWRNIPDWNKPMNQSQAVFDDAYAEVLDKLAFASPKTVMLRGRTREVIDEIPDESLDFAYIDGDHSLRGITIDLIKVLPKIKADGFIGGDDLFRDPWHHGHRFEPSLVYPFSVYFAEAHDLPMVALGRNQFLIQKRPSAGFSFDDRAGQYAERALGPLMGPAKD